MAERMKRCPKCKRLLPLDRFHNSKTATTGKCSYCPSCINDLQRGYFEAWLVHLVNYYHGKLQCCRCGYKKSYVALQWHHKDASTKKLEVGNFIRGHKVTERNIKVLEDELPKCIVLCSNCHDNEHGGKEIEEIYRKVKRNYESNQQNRYPLFSYQSEPSGNGG
jgi:hypothetical protein